MVDMDLGGEIEPTDVSRRAAGNAMLRAAARLAAVADALDELRGRDLNQEQRERRDYLLQEQWTARRRYEEAFARFNVAGDA